MHMKDTDRTEIYRYLGYRTQKPDAVIQNSVEEVYEEIMQAVTPRFLSKPVTIRHTSDHDVLIDDYPIISSSLASHLDSCRTGFLLAATLGAKVDLLIQRYHIVDISKALVAQACAAVIIETYCDSCQESLLKEPFAAGLYMRPRYSPGYGDFGLQYQKFFLEHLQAQKRIGLTLTDGYLLVPSKSITAVIGMTDVPTSCHIHKCMTCSQKQCPFRKGDGAS